MTEPADPTDDPAPLRLVGFERIEGGLYRLTLDAVSVELDADEARRLSRLIESEIGSAWARTLKPERKP